MTVFLLDINLLLALFDPGHEQHQLAHRWYGGMRHWASCPITESGFVRIAASPAYPGGLTNPQLIADKLRSFQRASAHTFWEDRPSLLDRSIYHLDQLRNSKHMIDLYLLGLAMQQGGKLATLDPNIPFCAVAGGQTALELISLEL